MPVSRREDKILAADVAEHLQDNALGLVGRNCCQRILRWLFEVEPDHIYLEENLLLTHAHAVQPELPAFDADNFRHANARHLVHEPP
jgi:hypothetical protein